MRKLREDDIPRLEEILVATGAFTDDEVKIAVELLETVISDPHQQDYQVAVAEVGGQVAGYVLFGPVPLTEGNYDLYWIAVSPSSQGAELVDN